MKYSKVLLFLVVIIPMSCLERFDPDLTFERASDELVVEGILNKDDKFFEIKLSNSIPRGSFVVNAFINTAEVKLIEKSTQSSYEFDLTDDGTYTLSSRQVTLKVGEQYKISITLENEDRYESTYEEVLKTVPLEKLEIDLTRGNYIVSGRVINGELLSIKSSLSKDSNQNSYYRFNYEGVYAFRAPYQGSDICKESEIIDDAVVLDELICYMEDLETLPINAYSNKEIKEGASIMTEILTIQPNRKFAFGYNMIVNKRTITQGYFNYLESIKSQVNQQGSILDPPPSKIIGNISRVDDTNIKALGYFTIESVDSNTIFIPNDFFKEPIVDPLNEYACNFSGETPDVKPDEWCCDCRKLAGAVTEPPENWPDK